MPRVLRSILVFSAFAGAVSLGAQTANDIMARHLAAAGGKDAINQVKSLSMETTTSMAGNDMPGTVVILEGVAFRSESDFNGMKIVQCYTATGGWYVNPAAGVTDPTPMPDDQYRAGKNQIFLGGDLHDYAAEGNKLELLGKDATTYTVKLTPKDGVEATYVFDAATYLIKSITRKGKFQDQEVTITTSLSDYRKTDGGLVLPYAMNVNLGGQLSLDISVDKVEVNKTVDPAICAMPKTSPPQTSQPPAQDTATPHS